MSRWVRKLFSRKANANCTAQTPQEAEYLETGILPPPPDYWKSVSRPITDYDAEAISRLHESRARREIAERRGKALRRARRTGLRLNGDVGWTLGAGETERVAALYHLAVRHENQVQEDLKLARLDVERLWVLVIETDKAVCEDMVAIIAEVNATLVRLGHQPVFFN